jgi:hypothetical protein
MKKVILYNGWQAIISGRTLTVIKDGEQREYTLPEEPVKIEEQGEYFFIHTESFYYSFKFEVDNFFVGDKFDHKENHLGEIACHVFGDE